ncbi:ABC transporter ATP-binding protein [Actinomycetaceae bacterium MB13-C1-2]|nr:ABC transporter ATP-binding protein [Actinomycetaceae bacterium MB13-C1-2]
MDLITVRDLRKRYKQHDAIDGITFSVSEGECVALLGPNGAGKTTTIEILEGFRSPSSGAVSVLGENPRSGGPQWRNRVGVVLQSTFEASSLTVREELKLAQASYSNPRTVDETLHMVGLETKDRARVAQLSGGQRRRLDVALGIIGRPELLFLDEPTTGFDPSARRSFQNMLASLHQRGLTIVLTTHYLAEAAVLADRVLVLSNGHVIAEGAPEDLGGQAAHTPRVTWYDPASGQTRTEVTATPTALIENLAAKLGEIPELQVIRPTLEEVYLELIAKDEAA